MKSLSWEAARTLPIADLLPLLGVQVKLDREYRPKDGKTRRLRVCFPPEIAAIFGSGGAEIYLSSGARGERFTLCKPGERPDILPVHCGRTGCGAIDIVMRLYNIGFPQAVAQIRRLFADELRGTHGAGE
jgi:hypothetical protein